MFHNVNLANALMSRVYGEDEIVAVDGALPFVVNYHADLLV